MCNYWFGGGLLQREVSDRLTLGGELSAQGPDAEDASSTTIGNVRGYWNFTPGFGLLFSAGHSLAGEHHSIAIWACIGPGAVNNGRPRPSHTS
jgi:hypothetical protein